MNHNISIYHRSEVEPSRQITPHFHWGEFLCQCGQCQEQRLHEDLFPALEDVRERLGGVPLTITSGFRCPDHNAAVGGASRSRHMYGEAVDIKSAGATPLQIAKAAFEEGFSGIRVYESWTHLDLREDGPWHVGF